MLPRLMHEALTAAMPCGTAAHRRPRSQAAAAAHGNSPAMARKGGISTYLTTEVWIMREHVSEVDLMSATYLRSFRRRIERRWMQGINLLRRIRDRIIGATEQALPGAYVNDGSLVPIPVKTTAARRRDLRRAHD